MNPLSEFNENGFLSFRKLLSYVFPKNGSPEPNITQNRLIHALAYINPLFAFLLMGWMFYWPHYLIAKAGVHEGLGIFFLYLCWIPLLFIVPSTLFLLFCAAVLKFKQRSPAIPLILTVMSPLKIVMVLGFICLLGYGFFPNSTLLNDSAKCRLIKNTYFKTHHEVGHPSETFWGFSPGHSTYQMVVEILRQSGADFEESAYLSNPRIPVIQIRSYQGFKELGPLKHVELSFGKDKRLFSIKLESLTPNVFSNLQSLFYAKYNPLMQESRLQEPEGVYFTPSGVKIQTRGNGIKLTVPAMEQSFQSVKKQVEEEAKIAHGKQFSNLIGEK